MVAAAKAVAAATAMVILAAVAAAARVTMVLAAYLRRRQCWRHAVANVVTAWAMVTREWRRRMIVACSDAGAASLSPQCLQLRRGDARSRSRRESDALVIMNEAVRRRRCVVHVLAVDAHTRLPPRPSILQAPNKKRLSAKVQLAQPCAPLASAGLERDSVAHCGPSVLGLSAAVHLLQLLQSPAHVLR
jgi:hypothetical protein